VDAFICVYLLYCVVSGWRRGLAACFFGIVAGLASIIGAVLLCKPLMSVLDTYTGAGDIAAGYIKRALSASLPAASGIDRVIQAMRFPAFLGVRLDIAGGMEIVADFLGRAALAGVCFTVLLVVLRIVLVGISRIMAFPFQQGPAALVNRVAGAALGGALGFANVAVLWVLMMPLVGVGAIRPAVIQGSYFLGLAADLVARVTPWVMGWTRMGGS
jgi:uncharacterized membrane protein required for colicin V production